MPKAPVYASWLPPKWELADAGALQAMARGEADAAAQQRALKWIVEAACGTYDLSFRPAPDGERATSFAEGRRFVGLEIVKLTKLNLASFRQKERE
jgi:hypothetical protein